MSRHQVVRQASQHKNAIRTSYLLKSKQNCGRTHIVTLDSTLWHGTWLQSMKSVQQFTLNSTQLLHTGQKAKGSVDTPHSPEIKHTEKRFGGGLGISTNFC